MAKPKKGVMPAALKRYWANKRRGSVKHMSKRRKVSKARSYAPRYARARRRGGKLGFGGFNIKNILSGVIGLFLAKKAVGTNSLLGFSMGLYDPGLQKIAAGAGLGAVGFDNHDLLTAGVKELVATAIDSYVGGGGLLGGGNGSSLDGGYAGGAL